MTPSASISGANRSKPDLEVVYYTTAHGLPADVSDSGILSRSDDDKFFIGTDYGVAAFYPDELIPPGAPPRMTWTGVRVHGELVDTATGEHLDEPFPRTIEDSARLVLRHDQNFITLDAAILDYIEPLDHEYSYRVVELGHDWSTLDGGGTVDLLLSPGDYTVQVRGANHESVWCDTPLTMTVVVLPPWWATPMVRAIAALLVLTSIGGAFLWRVSAMRRRNIALECQVSERTRELAIAKDSAETASQAKSAFLASMSHELRTPLNSILGFSQIMEREPECTASQRANLRTINRSGEHLLNLINDVLTMSKIEASRITLDETDFDLHETLDVIESMLGLRARGKGLQLVIECADSVPQYVHGDQIKIRQVLLNIIGNAVKFTSEGGVAVRVRGEDPEPSAPTKSATLRLVIEVEDTGPGIEADQLAQIFEPFVQTREGATATEGTGLGLAISRQFIQLMHGDIRATNTPGEGTVFRFDVYISHADKARLAPLHSDELRIIGLIPGTPRPRVLIVDDKDDNRALLVSLMGRLELAVREAANGERAIGIWRDWHPDLIWMDMNMPILNGYEATSQIRREAGDDGPVIIAVTASAFEEDRERVMSCGCDAFVGKPYRESQVFQAMAMHLDLEYVYAEQTQAEPPAPATVELAPALLNELDPKVTAELHRCALVGDIAALEELIREIRPHHEDLAQSLADLASAFRYESIVEATEDIVRKSNT